jgi:hypothetical protein
MRAAPGRTTVGGRLAGGHGRARSGKEKFRPGTKHHEFCLLTKHCVRLPTTARRERQDGLEAGARSPWRGSPLRPGDLDPVHLGPLAVRVEPGHRGLLLAFGVLRTTGWCRRIRRSH